jgi:hypothetical protein
MEAKWLSVQSFFRNQSLISAINALCIHWKLQMEGIEDEEDEEDVKEARILIRDFLVEFDRQVANYERSMFQILPGVDPRQFALVKRFVSAKRRKDFSSVTFKDKPGKVIELLDNENPNNLEPLVNALTELRILLEEHNQADVQNLVPEI